MTEPTDGKKANLWAYILIGAAGLGMLFIGVPLFSGGSHQNTAAEVNGQTISQYQLNAAASQLSAQQNHAETGELRKAALDSLIAQTLLSQHALANGYEYSDQALEQVLRQQYPTQEAYENALRSAGTNAKAFEAGIRAQQTQQNYYQMLTAAPADKLQLDTLLSQLAQERDADIALLPLAAFAANISPSDSDLETYYNAHKADYRTQQTADIQYILLDSANLADPNAITDADLAAHSQRSGAYVIFDKAEDADAAAKALQDGTTTFAQLTQEVKDGKISGQAGTLDKHAKGKGVSQEADDALFALAKTGDTSPAFDTEYGKMIVELGAIDNSGADIRQQLAAEKAEEAYTQLANKLFDAAQNGSSIADLAKDAGTAPVTLTGLTAGANSPAWLQNPQVQNQLFGENGAVLNKTAEPIQIDSGKSLFFTVTKREQPREQNLDDVKAQVRQAYIDAEAGIAQQALAEKIQDAWKAGKDYPAADIQAAGGTLSSYKNISQIEKPETAGLPEALYIPLLQQTEKTAILPAANGALAVSRLTAIREGKAADVPQDIAAITAQQRRFAARQQALAGIETYLRSQAKISINDSTLQEQPAQ